MRINLTKKDIINFFNIPENKITVVYQGCNEVFKKPVTENIKREILSK